MVETDDAHEEGLIHDEVEIEDFEYDPETETFTYPCPCGDEFVVSREELFTGARYARCPSCSLVVQVVYKSENLALIVETKSAMKPNKKSSEAIGIRATK